MNKKTILFLFSILFILGHCSFTTFAETPSFSSTFSSTLTSTQGDYTSFIQNNTGNTCGSPVSITTNGFARFQNDMSLTPINGRRPSNKYSYNRQAVFMPTSTMSSEIGLTIKLKLKLNMENPLESLSVQDGFGRTGFIINVRDYLTRNIDNEFYFCIAKFNDQLVISSIGGDRNNLAEQPVEYVLLNVSPDIFHTYLFSYNPLTGIDLYVDNHLYYTFSLASVGERSSRTGHFYSDFVALSLVNRSINAKLSAPSSTFTAKSEAFLDFIKIYSNTPRLQKQFSLFGAKDTSPQANDINQKSTECLQTVYSTIANTNITNNVILFTEATASRDIALKRIKDSSVFLFLGHGNHSVSSGNYVVFDSTSANGTLSSKYIKEQNVDLSDCELILFFACQTANAADNALTLPDICVKQGAETSVGFPWNIPVTNTCSFVPRVFNSLANGNSVKTAFDDAALINSWDLIYNIVYPDDHDYALRHYLFSGNEELVLY